MDEDDWDYFDNISVPTEPLQKLKLLQSKISNGTNSRYSLSSSSVGSTSRNTLYYSTMDLDGSHTELTQLNGPNHYENRQHWNTFQDGECVDYILAYDDQHKHQEKRTKFEKNLVEAGLILEWDENQMIHFVKIRAPKEVLCQYAEILKLRMPMRVTFQQAAKNVISTTINKILEVLSIRVNKDIFPPEKYTLTYEYSRDKDYLFNSDSPTFFKTSHRIQVVDYILEREEFGDHNCDKGINKLIHDRVYKAAYPLHEALHQPGSKRKILLENWASVTRSIQYQPIDEIKDYFGVKFALYFTWLGFYTHMLIPASVIGVICFIYGIFSLTTDTYTQDICTKNITMCPRCDKYCDFWQLSESCTYSKIVHLIDNPATICFAVFMSFWSAIYLELWKRYSAEITHRWGLTGFDLLAEPPRPEYLLRLGNAKKKKINVVTQLEEPAVSFFKVRLPAILLSFSVVTICMIAVLAVVTGIILYRMSLFSSETFYSDKTSYRIYVVPITAAVINLVIIQIFNLIYSKLAVYLTEMELNRTETEYGDSLALKIYLFQFINLYSSIFYIAFLKGKFVGYPAKYNRVFRSRQEECNPGGCLMELTMQLAIIMIGYQTMNTLIEYLIPLVMKMYNTFKVTTGIEKASEKNSELIISCNQWTEDYKLNEFTDTSLFQEYLEMVLQYGFVTLFVTAFPLAPLFALLNNVLEMRLDARKFLKFYRRPVPTRVKDIGVWLPIMAILARISVISNAFIIAFSSNFIPKLVYMLRVSENHSSEGFLEHSLAYFNTADFPIGTAPVESAYNITTCRYAEYRNPPDDLHKYKRPLIYWHILAARLAFIVAYQNIVSFVITVVDWSIPDIPKRVNDQIKREAYLTTETILQHEANKVRRKKTRDLGRRFNSESRENQIESLPGSNRSTIYYDTEL